MYDKVPVSRPKPRSPANASPLNLIRTRLNVRRSSIGLFALANCEADDADDVDRAASVLRFLLQEVSNLFALILVEGLLKKHHALHDLLIDAALGDVTGNLLVFAFLDRSLGLRLDFLFDEV